MRLTKEKEPLGRDLSSLVCGLFQESVRDGNIWEILSRVRELYKAAGVYLFAFAAKGAVLVGHTGMQASEDMEIARRGLSCNPGNYAAFADDNGLVLPIEDEEQTKGFLFVLSPKDSAVKRMERADVSEIHKVLLACILSTKKPAAPENADTVRAGMPSGCLTMIVFHGEVTAFVPVFRKWFSQLSISVLFTEKKRIYLQSGGTISDHSERLSEIRRLLKETGLIFQVYCCEYNPQHPISFYIRFLQLTAATGADEGLYTTEDIDLILSAIAGEMKEPAKEKEEDGEEAVTIVEAEETDVTQETDMTEEEPETYSNDDLSRFEAMLSDLRQEEAISLSETEEERNKDVPVSTQEPEAVSREEIPEGSEESDLLKAANAILEETGTADTMSNDTVSDAKPIEDVLADMPTLDVAPKRKKRAKKAKAGQLQLSDFADLEMMK